MQFGKRRLDSCALYNLREGLTAADDTLPIASSTEPVGIGRLGAKPVWIEERFQTYPAPTIA